MLTQFINKYIFFIVSTALITVSTANADIHSAHSASNTPDTVTSIIISGNRKTKTSVVLQLAKIHVGMPSDSTLIIKTKRRLMQSGLFNKADILLHKTSEGTRVYIILNEKFYFLPYDLGGELYGYRYGIPKTWWRLRIGLEYRNFRGRAEVLRTSFSIWDWRSFGIGWYKPLLPSPYYFSIGASVNVLPDQVFKIDHSILRSSVTFGRKLPYNSRIGLSLTPLYRRRIEYDSLMSPHDTAHVYEAFSMLRFSTDHRNRQFDPDKGWLFFSDIRTNALYTRIAPSFSQLTFDLRSYLPGIAPSHRLAFKSTATLRNIDAGVTHRMLLGGEGSVRGYAQNQFGRYFNANNTFTVSCEYRFTLFNIYNVPLYPLNRYHPALSTITYRFDGAAIIDYGRVSFRYEDLFSSDADLLETGTGIGFGLRLLVPELEHTVCFDVLWGTDPWAKKGYYTFLEQPSWHFYLDTFF